MNNYYKKYFIFNIIRDKIHVKGAVMNFFWKPKKLSLYLSTWSFVTAPLS